MNDLGPTGSKVYAVDFDKTLATHNSDEPYNHRHLGEPIQRMVDKVKELLASGHRVVIYTARVNPGNSYEEQAMATDSCLFIADWCQQVFGAHLPITFAKSKDMELFIDDRAVPVVPNEGIILPSGMDQEPAA